MDEKVRQFLKSHEKDFELLQNGKIRCLVTNHEMPARIEDLQRHIQGKKYKMQKECYSMDFSKYEPDIVPSRKPKKLWCKVTHMQLNAIPAEVEKHINGRRFKAAKAQRELEKQARAKRLADLQPEDGPDVSLFADALSESIEDDEEPSESKEEEEEGVEGDEEENESEVEEDEEEAEEGTAVADPFASEEEEEQKEEKKPEKKQKHVEKPVSKPAAKSSSAPQPTHSQHPSKKHPGPLQKEEKKEKAENGQQKKNTSVSEGESKKNKSADQHDQSAKKKQKK